MRWTNCGRSDCRVGDTWHENGPSVPCVPYRPIRPKSVRGTIMAGYLAGVDVGTTGARCMIFDTAGRPLGGHYCDYGATYPQPGWVEQDGDLLIGQGDGGLPGGDRLVGHPAARDRFDRIFGPAFGHLRRRPPGPRRAADVLLAGRSHGGRGRGSAAVGGCRRVLRAKRAAAGHDLDRDQAAVDAQARTGAVRPHAQVRPEPGPGAAGVRRRRLLHRPVLHAVLRRLGRPPGDLERIALEQAGPGPRAVRPADSAGHAGGRDQRRRCGADGLCRRHADLRRRRRPELQRGRHGGDPARHGHRHAGHGRAGDPVHGDGRPPDLAG